jgi:hypothetical protein
MSRHDGHRQSAATLAQQFAESACLEFGVRENLKVTTDAS